MLNVVLGNALQQLVFVDFDRSVETEVDCRWGFMEEPRNRIRFQN